jgi:metallo-beta-lactamase class B
LNVMFGCSLRPPAVVTPLIADEFDRAFKAVRSLPCDVQLGDHGAQYNMQENYAKLKDAAPNPFIDTSSCTLEADVEEAMFHAILSEQQQAPRP